MRFKTIDCNTHFADAILKKYINNNKYLFHLCGNDHAIDGSHAGVYLTDRDPIDTSNAGAGAGPQMPIVN
jgi:hypothetical protein